MIRTLLVVFACLPFAALANPLDDEMNRLAAASGCALCHSAHPPKGDAVLPPGPAWSEIARRYKGRAGAEDKLVAAVVQGTGPANRHWAGKTSAVEMQANKVEISEADARRLIQWILR